VTSLPCCQNFLPLKRKLKLRKINKVMLYGGGELLSINQREYRDEVKYF